MRAEDLKRRASIARCEAQTKEGKRCTMKASATVGAGDFCGNHAKQAQATQLKDSAPIFAMVEAGVSNRAIGLVLAAWKAGKL